MSNFIYIPPATSASGNGVSLTEVENLLGGYLPVGGGTLSGSLNTPSVYMTNSNNSDKIGILSNATPISSYSLKLPSNLPASNGQVLSSDTSGNLSWTANGSPTGATGSLAYFNGQGVLTSSLAGCDATGNISTDIIISKSRPTTLKLWDPGYATATISSAFTSLGNLSVINNPLTVANNQLLVFGGGTTPNSIQIATNGPSYINYNAGSALKATGSGLAGAIFATTSNAIYQDTSSSGSNQNLEHCPFYAFQAPNLTATNTGVNTTTSSTVYIGGPPSGGTNMTITNPYALYVNTGSNYFNGKFNLGPSYPTGTSASAGSLTLPSNPAGFLSVNLNGSAIKLPYYNN